MSLDLLAPPFGITNKTRMQPRQRRLTGSRQSRRKRKVSQTRRRRRRRRGSVRYPGRPEERSKSPISGRLSPVEAQTHAHSSSFSSFSTWLGATLILFFCRSLSISVIISSRHLAVLLHPSPRPSLLQPNDHPCQEGNPGLTLQPPRSDFYMHALRKSHHE